MAIPKYNEFMPTIITCLSDGNRHTTKELITFCANAFQLTEEERQRRLPTGASVCIGKSRRLGENIFEKSRAH